MEFLEPKGWKPPKGYSNGVSATGRHIFISGQVGWNDQCEFESDHFADQVRQALMNIVAILGRGGAGPEHIVRMTWYVTNKQLYLSQQEQVGAAYRAIIGRHYPAMSLVQVADLLEDRALVEIEATAVIE